MIDEGLHPEVPMSEYIADPCAEPSLSASIIHTLVSRSPMHARAAHPRLGGRSDESSRADLGSAAHAILLGGAERIACVEAADWRTQAARNARDEARAHGQIPILARQAGEINAMVASARRTLENAGLADFSRTEHTAIWREGETWCRARPDMIVGEDYIVDLKTASCAEPTAWIRSSLFAGGYHVQAAWYLRGLARVLPGPTRDFVFLACEIEPPYACSLVGLEPRVVELSERIIERGLALWRECLASGKWPGYDVRIHHAELPAWLDYDCTAKGITAEVSR